MFDAQDLFKAQLLVSTLESELDDILEQLDILDYDGDFTTDWYDSSIEFKEAKPDMRLSEEQRSALKAMNFQKCWICHTDGWETFYNLYYDSTEERRNTHEKV